MDIDTITSHHPLQSVVKQIIGYYNPQQIVLFGSQAYGTPTQDSDVDLLVIMDTSIKEIEQAIQICRTIDYHFGLDLIVRKPETIHHRLNLGDPFMQDIMSKGKVLYERIDN